MIFTEKNYKPMTAKTKKKISKKPGRNNKYYLKNRRAILEQLKEKYKKDKKFRAKVKKYYSEKYHTDEEYHKKTLEAARNRYHTDPEYRQKTIERTRKRHAMLRRSAKSKKR